MQTKCHSLIGPDLTDQQAKQGFGDTECDCRRDFMLHALVKCACTCFVPCDGGGLFAVIGCVALRILGGFWTRLLFLAFCVPDLALFLGPACVFVQCSILC
jgi:hypothetical protein